VGAGFPRSNFSNKIRQDGINQKEMNRDGQEKNLLLKGGTKVCCATIAISMAITNLSVPTRPIATAASFLATLLLSVPIQK